MMLRVNPGQLDYLRPTRGMAFTKSSSSWPRVGTIGQGGMGLGASDVELYPGLPVTVTASLKVRFGGSR